MTRRSRKVVDTAPTWAPFHGWSVLFQHDRPCIGLGPETTDCRSFASEIERLTDAIAALAFDDFARLPVDSLHITLCDGANVGLRLDDAPVEPCDSLGTVAGEITDLVAAASVPIEWMAESLEIRGHAVVVPVATDSDLTEVSARRHRLLRRLGEVLGTDLDGDWRPHVTLGYLLDHDHVAEHRENTVRIWHATRTPAPNPPPRLTTRHAAVYEFDDMATFRLVDPQQG